ncbi:MAG: glutamine amidotransferase of anthranilate synthase [Bacteroidetes bacterium]|uniref:anthranilate synthase component II n=1 Tax=[Flexibacter] sp. ATCC 35208 TaxID=1936242 RepID=UPI0009CD76CD|nr:aminodeoxychorismate/anthranilate synthase component II [[Flexibacter] sp. ATCC 35208]MBP1652298.1 glutamine amidotransferase of anthranilate synthase [Bacteroidota bacterium]OMP80384.1 aminodeoxychorismate/anthranilate synthase component II [[Flexibacter] sp. ATCC 35208]
MNILVFDNYDSFTYNLVHLVEKIINGKVSVFRNDEIPLEKVKDYDKIILSPGPGIPEEAGMLLPLIKEYAATKSIFGVCLGQQAIGEAFGASLINLKDVYHGVATPVNIISREGRLFNGLPDQLEVGRYHSWVVDEKTLPSSLTVTAKDDNGYIMALQHQQYDVSGVQFHPESVLTPEGEKIIRNWLNA